MGAREWCGILNIHDIELLLSFFFKFQNRKTTTTKTSVYLNFYLFFFSSQIFSLVSDFWTPLYKLQNPNQFPLRDKKDTELYHSLVCSLVFTLGVKQEHSMLGMPVYIVDILYNWINSSCIMGNSASRLRFRFIQRWPGRFSFQPNRRYTRFHTFNQLI